MFAILGIILLIGGAIVTFAIDTAVDGVDLESLGYIMMAGGVLSLIVAAIRGAGFMTAGRRRVVSERHVSADGNHVIEETDTH